MSPELAEQNEILRRIEKNLEDLNRKLPFHPIQPQYIPYPQPIYPSPYWDINPGFPQVTCTVSIGDNT